jgi:hypothetical protein
MMTEKKNPRELIIDTVIDKNIVKRQAFNNTLRTFETMKDTCRFFENMYNKELVAQGSEPLFEYKDRGVFDADLQVAGDLLVFNMHSNIFNFDKSHRLWRSSYLQNRPNASYCGMISIYNFLADSFKYNRTNDIGYLIARVFVNCDNHIFVEGKRQLGFLYNDFVNTEIEGETVEKIIESALLFTLDFDLLVPEYDTVNAITVAQMLENLNNAKIQTAKRLGFKFNADNNDL